VDVLKDDYLQSQIAASENFEMLVESYLQYLQNIKDLSNIISYLKGVLIDYNYKIEDKIIIFLQQGKNNLKKSVNAYFLVKYTLHKLIIERIKHQQILIFNSKCCKCESIQKIEIISEIKKVTVLSAKPYESLDFCLHSLNDIYIGLIFEGEFPKMSFRKLMKDKSRLIIFYFNPNKIQGVEMFNFICEHCNDSSIKTQTNLTSSNIDNRYKKPNSLKITDNYLNRPDFRFNHNPIIVDPKIYLIKKFLKESLQQNIPIGKYKGKSYLWVLTFDPGYIEELLARYDQEDTMREFFKKIYFEAFKIEFQDFPEIKYLNQYI
jgi:hypothetical protein